MPAVSELYGLKAIKKLLIRQTAGCQRARGGEKDVKNEGYIGVSYNCFHP